VSDEQTHRRLMEALLFAAIEPLDEATLAVLRAGAGQLGWSTDSAQPIMEGAP